VVVDSAPGPFSLLTTQHCLTMAPTRPGHKGKGSTGAAAPQKKVGNGSFKTEAAAARSHVSKLKQGKRIEPDDDLIRRIAAQIEARYVVLLVYSSLALG
jgi:hypothetical protein